MGRILPPASRPHCANYRSTLVGRSTCRRVCRLGRRLLERLILVRLVAGRPAAGPGARTAPFIARQVADHLFQGRPRGFVHRLVSSGEQPDPALRAPVTACSPSRLRLRRLSTSLCMTSVIRSRRLTRQARASVKSPEQVASRPGWDRRRVYQPTGEAPRGRPSSYRKGATGPPAGTSAGRCRPAAVDGRPPENWTALADVAQPNRGTAAGRQLRSDREAERAREYQGLHRAWRVGVDHQSHHARREARRLTGGPGVPPDAGTSRAAPDGRGPPRPARGSGRAPARHGLRPGPARTG